MSSGKAAAQAGHAFLASYLKAEPEQAAGYIIADGAKVVLASPDEKTLIKAYNKACKAGLPCVLWTEGDLGITALGIGPADRALIKPIVKKLKLL